MEEATQHLNSAAHEVPACHVLRDEVAVLKNAAPRPLQQPPDPAAGSGPAWQSDEVPKILSSTSFLPPLRVGEVILLGCYRVTRHKAVGISPLTGARAGRGHLPHSSSGKSSEPKPYPAVPKQ